MPKISILSKKVSTSLQKCPLRYHNVSNELDHAVTKWTNWKLNQEFCRMQFRLNTVLQYLGLGI